VRRILRFVTNCHDTGRANVLRSDRARKASRPKAKYAVNSI
jgi:hypothetical protein